MRDVDKQRRTPLPVRTGRTRSDCRAAPVSHNQVRQREQHIQFGRPRYRVFRYRNCPFMTANTCSSLARTDDFWCSAFFALHCPLADSFLICVGLQFCLYLIFLPCLFRTMASCRFSTPIYPLSPYNSLLVQKRHAHLLVHVFIIAHYCPIFNAFALRGGALIHRFSLWAVTPFVRFSLQESYTTKERKCL